MKINCSHTELVQIAELKPHPKNRNQHTPEQLKLLAKIMKHQGWRNPIVVSKRSGHIVAGHARRLSALVNGWTEAPVDYQDFKSDQDEYAHLTADNEIARLAKTDLAGVLADVLDFGPDFDFDLLGIPDFKLPEDFEPQSDEDSIPEHVEPKSKLGDIYQLGRHRLMCGDSTSIDAVEKLMGGEKADMVFTDPPYNIDYCPEDRPIGGRARSENKLGKIENDKMDDDSFLEFMVQVNASILIVVKDGAAIYECAPIGMNNLYYLQAWKNAGFHYSDGLIWFKNNHSISRKDYHPKHEVIHYGWKAGSHKWYGERNKFSVFECSREKAQDYEHPTQKPVELSSHFIVNSSKDGDVVLDLFGGSGSTLIACEKTNRKCFMMELDPHYCSVIIERWQKYTGKEAYRVEANGDQTPWSKITI